MISSNVMSFVKKIVKASDDDGSSSSGATGGFVPAGNVSPGGTIGKLRQTVASGMKEIREKTVSSTAPSATSKPLALSQSDLRLLTDDEKGILDCVWVGEAGFTEEVPPPRPSACRVCLKSIGEKEVYYMCSECHEGVCDDCAAYKQDSCEDPERWRCSFCIRRQERLNAEAASGMRRISSAHRMSQDLPYSLKQSFSDEGRTDSVDSLYGPQRSPPPTERGRRASSIKISSPDAVTSPFPLTSSEKLTGASKSTDSISSRSCRPSSMDHGHKQDVSKASLSPKGHDLTTKSPSVHLDHSPHKTSRQDPAYHSSIKTSPQHLSHETHLSKYSPSANSEASGLKSTGPKSSQIQKQVQISSMDVKQASIVAPRSAPTQRKILSPADKSLSYNAPDTHSSRLDFHRSSMPGILATDRPPEISPSSAGRRANDRPRAGDMPYRESYSSVGDQAVGYQSTSHRKDTDKSKHTSLEGTLRDRKTAADSTKVSRALPQPHQSSHGPPPSPCRVKMSSASESSVEDKSPEEDAECRRRNRMRRTRFQRQKTFIDEHDPECRDEWMMTSYSVDEANSSFDSSSAFESFDTDVEAPSYRRSHGYHQAVGRGAHHMASDMALYQRRRSSDSSEFSDITSDVSAFRRQIQGGARRHLVNRNVASDYDVDLRYHGSSQYEGSGLDDRNLRNRMEKSLSVEDPESVLRKSQRRAAESADDRRRHPVHDYGHDSSRSSAKSTYQYNTQDNRNYQNQQVWTRCARSLEMSVDTQEFRRSSLNEGEKIKIVIDDVDAGTKGYQSGSQSGDIRTGLRRNFQERGVKSLEWTDSIDWRYEDSYDDSARSLTVNTRHKASSASDVRRDVDYHQSPVARRRLPMTPDQAFHGEIGIRVHYEAKRNELVVTVVAAKGLKRQKPTSGNGPRAYATVRLTPFTGFRSMETHIAEATVNPEWNKTCAFPGVAMEELFEKVLELTVFDAEQGLDKKVLLGSATISLQNADFKDSLLWYPLSHRSASLLSHPHKASSTGMLVSTPAHDIARRLLSRGAQREMLQSQSLTDDGPAECYGPEDDQGLVKSTSMDSTLLHPDDAWAQDALEGDDDQSYTYPRGAGDGRVAHDSYPLTTQDSLPDMYCSDLEPADWQKHVVYDLRSVNSDTEAGNGALRRQRQRNSFVRRRMGRVAENTVEHAARSVVIGGSSTDTEPSQSVDNPSYMLSSKKRSPSILKNPKPEKPQEAKTEDNASKSKYGELKLGFSLQKGYLHIEVIRARGIRHTANGHPPDTYVKTYLRNGEIKSMKRKTSVVRQSTEPKFHQTIKYAVGDINRKTLLAMIWERHKRFEHNQALGIVELDLGKMKLTKPFTSWYQLKPLHPADTESMGSS